MKFSIRVH